jgi:hypothetical protein
MDKLAPKGVFTVRNLSIVALLTASSFLSFAQNEPVPQNSATANKAEAGQSLKQRSSSSLPQNTVEVEPGTHILLSMINSVSTKAAAVGDRIYLETAFPVLCGARIVIPQGSWVAGTITHVKRPGRVKGRGELQVRFDSITLPNGISRSFRSDLGALDARSGEKLNREKGTITSAGNKKGDTETIAGTATTGTIIGSGIGAAAGGIARGAGIGAGAGAAAGILGVLLSRGPDAMLTKGSTIEMVLDRPLLFETSDLNFSSAPPHASQSEGSAPPVSSSRRWSPKIP